MVTLRAMALDGMRDHIGGGFHRYSVDGNWRVPPPRCSTTRRRSCWLLRSITGQRRSVLRANRRRHAAIRTVRMTDARGGFYSAEDADSLPPESATSAEATVDKPADTHKVEGAFYVWTADEIKTQLGDDSAIFEGRYGILQHGNAPFDPQQEFVNKNLLYTAHSISDLAKSLTRTPIGC